MVDARLGVLEEIGSFLEIRVAQLAVEELWIILLLGHVLLEGKLLTLASNSMTFIAVHRDYSEAQLKAIVALLVAVPNLLDGPQRRRIRWHFSQAIYVDLVVFVANVLAPLEGERMVLGAAL